MGLNSYSAEKQENIKNSCDPNRNRKAHQGILKLLGKLKDIKIMNTLWRRKLTHIVETCVALIHVFFLQFLIAPTHSDYVVIRTYV